MTFFDESRGKQFQQEMEMLLPHELLHSLLKVNSIESLRGQEQTVLASRPDLQQHLQDLRSRFGPQDPVLLGLWIDAVPFNSDRSQSLECITLNVLGQKDLRLPIAAVPKAFLAKRETHDQIFHVLAWSMRALLADQFPTARHDGAVWTSGDAYRQRLQGRPLGLTATVCEVRGDWAMFKEVLSFPSWAAHHICWLCNIEKKDIAVVSQTADWRLLGCSSLSSSAGVSSGWLLCRRTA
jgi:hypothetical protein